MKKTTIFAYGASKGDPGPAVIAVQIIDADGKILQEISESIGNATNIFADYFAVVRGLQSAVELFGDKTREINFILNLDNELVNKHLNAEEQIKDVSLVGHFIEIYNLRVASFPKFKSVIVKRDSIEGINELLKDTLN